jgi:hypothetical protein
MHIFAKGKHNSDLGLGDAALDLWPMLLEAWLRDLGLLTPHQAIGRALRDLISAVDTTCVWELTRVHHGSGFCQRRQSACRPESLRRELLEKAL